jgi:hypothetical protein
MQELQLLLQLMPVVQLDAIHYKEMLQRKRMLTDMCQRQAVIDLQLQKTHLHFHASYTGQHFDKITTHPHANKETI